MTKKTRKILIIVIKFAVAAGLLWLVLRKVHWNDYTSAVEGETVALRGFKTTVMSANPYLLAAAFVCFFLPLIVLGVRWWYLLRIVRVRISLGEAIRMTLLGEFYNCVIPGTVSGDLVKVYYVAKHTDRKAAVLVSAFTDRVVGLFEFAILPAVAMAVMFLVGKGDFELLRYPIIAVIVVFVAVGVTMGVMLSPTLRQRLGLRRLLKRLPLQKHLSVAGQATALYRRRFRSLLRALLITFGGQMLFITAITLAGMSLNLPVAWYYYLLYVPLIYIIAAVPISPAGVGVTEYFYRFFFVAAGATTSEVLALALVVRLFIIIRSLPGLWVVLHGASMPKVEEMQAELAAAEEAAVADDQADDTAIERPS